MENIKNIPSESIIWILWIGLVLGYQTFHVLSEGSTMEWDQSDYHNNSSFRGQDRLRLKVLQRQRQPLLSSSSSTFKIHLQTLFVLSSVECSKQTLLLIVIGDLGHAWSYKAHEIPALVYKDSHQNPHCVISVLLISVIVPCSVLRFLDWMDHACINGISPDCLAEVNKSSHSKLLENKNNSHKRNTVKARRIKRSNLKGHTHGCHTTKRSLLQWSKCVTTSNFQIQSSQHATRTLDNFTQHTRRNNKTSVWIFLFLFLPRFSGLAASPRDVPVKKCCPDGQVLNGSASCIGGSAPSPFNTILRGLDPSKSNYRDHPVDIKLVSMGSTGEPLPGRPDNRKLYRLEQGTAWLTVGGKLITSEFEAEFPHGEICVDSTMWGERAAVIKYPCKGNLCLTLCCPHGQALVDDPTIEAAIDENVPKICGNFDWEWHLKFWNKTNNAETTATRNYDFVLREDVKHAGSFSCPSNCGGKKGTLGFADSTYSQVRLYSDGTLSGKLGDITHLIENERFCVAYGDPPNYDYGEADTGMRVTYMVCSRPKCPPTEHGLPDAVTDKSVSLASMGWFIPSVITTCFIVLVVALLVAYAIHRKCKNSKDGHVTQTNGRGIDDTMEMRDRSGRDKVNIQTLSGDIEANKPQARDYLTEAMDTAKVMMLQGEKVRREDEEWTKERTFLLEDPLVKLALKSLEDHAQDEDEEFAKFLFDFLPPKHRDDCESLKKSLETGFNENRKKMLQKMVTFWHPDRVRKEEDKKHYIICEEVTKRLTNRYERLKC